MNDSCLNELRLKAPAKVNVGLRIVGRRPDEYHLLESLFWPINLCDELVLSSELPKPLSTVWAKDYPFPQQPLPEDTYNIAFAAWRWGSDFCRDRFPLPIGVRLEKRIPMGGGLGGGSSDAGALIRFFQNSLDMSLTDCRKYALELGADVPFFLDPKPGWVEGIGEKITRLTLDPALAKSLRFVLVLFPFATSTPGVFGQYRRAGKPFSATQSGTIPRVVTESWLREFLKRTGNDLEEMVAIQQPAIAEALQILRNAECWYAGLSGTGSTVFGICPHDDAAERTIKDLQQFCRNNGCRSIKTTTFTHD